MSQADFSSKVLNITKKIPRGFVSTYKLIAIAIDKPGSHRAVGNVLHKNKTPIIIPCHRVVKSDGSLGGYSGGCKNKQILLKKEGLEIKNNKIINLNKYLFKFE